MEERAKQENNELVAMFMGAEKFYYTVKGIQYNLYHYSEGHPFDIRILKELKVNMFNARDLKYHSSWDWLMPVVEKIKMTLVSSGIEYRRAARKKCIIEHYSILTPIDDVYKAVIRFITWHNNNQYK